MLKRKDGKEIKPDTFIYSVPAFRLVEHIDGMDEEYIFIRVAIADHKVFFIMISNNGQHSSYPISTNATFSTQWGNHYTVYECEVDNIDVEYH